MKEWHLVLSRDGTVLAATDGAPPDWVGRPFQMNDAPVDLKSAVGRLLGERASEGGQVACRIALQSVEAAVHVIVVDALPVRRVSTDLRTLLQSSLEVLQVQARAFDISLTLTIESTVPVDL